MVFDLVVLFFCQCCSWMLFSVSAAAFKELSASVAHQTVMSQVACFPVSGGISVSSYLEQ